MRIAGKSDGSRSGGPSANYRVRLAKLTSKCSGILSRIGQDDQIAVLQAAKALFMMSERALQAWTDEVEPMIIEEG